MIKIKILILSVIANFSLVGQTFEIFADSIRKKYKIPELGFAVVSQDKIIEQKVLGYKRNNADLKAEPTDKFRIGSNTKTVTGFIAAQLVKQNKIKWDTKFFDLFPDLKSESKPGYYDLTLLDLLSFRTQLIKWTYTDNLPHLDEMTGDEVSQRFQFAKWVLSQKPNESAAEINFSNPAYVLAGMMLEQCSGKNYKALVLDLGKQINVDFNFGPPNLLDSIHQPWGHDEELVAERPKENIKLNWLLPAGNINVNLTDYCKFIQEQLKGLSGNSGLLNKAEYEFLFYGLKGFSIGWFSAYDTHEKIYSYHFGNPGTFLSRVYVFNSSDRAFILFSNCQSAAADRGLDCLYRELSKRYLDERPR